MHIKEEPIDSDDCEDSISESSNVICPIQASTSFYKGKLDSCNISSEAHEQQPGENLHLELQPIDDVIVSSINLPTQIPTVGSNAISSSLPACENWSGHYDFSVAFRPQNKGTKGVAWTYSSIKDKLFVRKDAPCPINFSTNTRLADNVYIRVMALYTSPEQVAEIVTRCYNHSVVEKPLPEAEHLIRCESATAEYQTDSTGRHSVLVPFENPPVGQQYSTYIYKFACFGSCSGGPNRRPLMLIFTLEAGGQVIGRRKLDVKICACPGRDRKNEEAQYLPSELPQLSSANPNKRKQSDSTLLSEVMDFTKSIYAPLPKKHKATPNKDGLYYLSIDDKECYEFLRQMKKFYEICKTMKSMQPDALNKALQHIKIKSEKKEE